MTSFVRAGSVTSNTASWVQRDCSNFFSQLVSVLPTVSTSTKAGTLVNPQEPALMFPRYSTVDIRPQFWCSIVQGFGQLNVDRGCVYNILTQTTVSGSFRVFSLPQNCSIHHISSSLTPSCSDIPTELVFFPSCRESCSKVFWEVFSCGCRFFNYIG